MPYLQASETTWEHLNATEKSQLVKVNFLSQLENFVDMLKSAQESIDERIFLKPPERLDLNQLQNLSDYVSMAANSETLLIVEETMKTWIRQMEQVDRRALLFSFSTFVKTNQ